jgi:hypothetical protein
MAGPAPEIDTAVGNRFARRDKAKLGEAVEQRELGIRKVLRRIVIADFSTHLHDKRVGWDDGQRGDAASARAQRRFEFPRCLAQRREDAEAGHHDSVHAVGSAYGEGCIKDCRRGRSRGFRRGLFVDQILDRVHDVTDRTE